MTRVGIYSGTFDPLHAGHVGFAVAAMKACQLDHVYFIPEGSPRHKTAATPLSLRADAIRYALEPFEKLEILILTDRRLTIKQTLPQLHRLFPDATLCFLMGSDVVKSLGDWPDTTQLLQTCEIIISLRSGTPAAAIDDIFARLVEQTHIIPHYHIVDSPFASLASSQLRLLRRTHVTDQSA